MSAPPPRGHRSHVDPQACPAQLQDVIGPRTLVCAARDSNDFFITTLPASSPPEQVGTDDQQLPHDMLESFLANTKTPFWSTCVSRSSCWSNLRPPAPAACPCMYRQASSPISSATGCATTHDHWCSCAAAANAAPEPSCTCANWGTPQCGTWRAAWPLQALRPGADRPCTGRPRPGSLGRKP